jgi:hypothetical protein
MARHRRHKKPVAHPPVKSTLRSRLLWASAIAVVVGSLVFLFAWFTRDTLFFGSLADGVRDLGLSIQADSRDTAALSKAFVFVAIDDTAHEALGSYPFTPRDRLATLLGNVAAQKPAVIILDIDLAVPARNSADDAQFEAVLKTLAAAHTNLLLVREPSGAAPDGRDRFNATPYDAIIDATPTFAWVSAQGLRGSGDVVRRMQSWIRGCVGNTPAYYPNVAIATGTRFAISKPFLKAFPRPDWSCTARGPQPRDLTELNVPLGGLGVRSIRRLEPIDYSLRWTGQSSRQLLNSADGQMPLVTVLPASPLLDSHITSTDALRGSIAIIGTSYTGDSDQSRTPLGVMPGAYVAINHIRGLLDFGPEPPPSFWQNFILALGIALATANLMILAGEAWAPWVEIPLPLVLSALWVFALLFIPAAPTYFGLSLAPIIVGLAILALPHRLRASEEKKPYRAGRSS